MARHTPSEAMPPALLGARFSDKQPLCQTHNPEQKGDIAKEGQKKPVTHARIHKTQIFNPQQWLFPQEHRPKK
jgi:hypothetical protein